MGSPKGARRSCALPAKPSPAPRLSHCQCSIAVEQGINSMPERVVVVVPVAAFPLPTNVKRKWSSKEAVARVPTLLDLELRLEAAEQRREASARAMLLRAAGMASACGRSSANDLCTQDARLPGSTLPVDNPLPQNLS